MPWECSSVLWNPYRYYILSFPLDPSKTNSRTKASVGLFLQAGCWCCYRAHPVSRSNERWVGQPAPSTEIMICHFCSSKQNQKLKKTLLVCSTCFGNSYFCSFNFSADVHLFAVLVNVSVWPSPAPYDWS